MYPVTESYKANMGAQIRGAVLPKAEIISIDAPTQARITESSIVDNVAFPVFTSKVAKIDAAERPNIATLEPDYMRADGLYQFYDITDPHYYLSSDVSEATANENGEYAFLSPLNVQFNTNWDNTINPRPISVVFDSDVREVRGWCSIRSGSTSLIREFDLRAENGQLKIEDLVLNKRVNWIDISPFTMGTPYTRARIKHFYLGTVDLISSGDILSLSYSDIADGICEELPSRTAQLTVNNLSGKYNPETEYANPTFTKYNTQAILKLQCETLKGDFENLPLGRFFLDHYEVTKENLIFSFVSALSVLDETTHEWSTIPPSSLSSKLNEIVDVTGYGDARQWTAAERFGISLDYSKAKNLSNVVVNACPLVSSAQALQIYTNLSGNMMRIKRDGADVEIIDNVKTEDRHIRMYDLFAHPKWSAKDRIRRIICVVHELNGQKNPGEVLMNNTFLPGFYAVLNYNTADPTTYIYGRALGITETGEVEFDINTTVLAQYAYTAYLQCGSGGENTRIRADTQKIVERQQSYALGINDGVDYVANNPLMSDSGGFPSDSYAQRIYDELQYNLIADITHRGFPEIDAGDIITLETEEYPAVPIRVLENKFTINGGAMRGNSKVRRMA